MNQDFVFWGVIVCVVGAAAVVGYLFYWIYNNAVKGEDKQ